MKNRKKLIKMKKKSSSFEEVKDELRNEEERILEKVEDKVEDMLL